MTPKRETPQAIEERDTVEAKCARLFLPVLRGTVLIVALCASVPFLAGHLFEVYGGRWETNSDSANFLGRLRYWLRFRMRRIASA